MAVAARIMANHAPAWPTRSAQTRSACVDRAIIRGMVNVLQVRATHEILKFTHLYSNWFPLAELGEIAESSDECEYEFDHLSKTCICQKNYFYERDLRNCRKRE